MQPIKNKRKNVFGEQTLIFSLLLFLILGLALESTAQVQWNRESLTRGKLWSTIGNALQLGQPVDPGNVYFVLDYPGYSKGTDVSDALNYAEAAGYSIYAKREGNELAYSINSRYYPSSQYVTALENAELIQNYNMADLSLDAEEIITGKHHVKDLDVDIAHKSMVWSYPKYDDFIIHEVEITNTGTTQLEEIYFGFRYGYRFTERSNTNSDEKFGWDESRQMFYFYDDASFRWEDETPITWNFGAAAQKGDISDPRDRWEQGSTEHELDAPAYVTALCLDPAGSTIYQNIVRYLGQGRASNEPMEDRPWLQGADQPSVLKALLSHQQPRMSWDEAKAAGGEGGNKYERQPEFYTSCGPLQLNAGASVTVVFAEVVGEMDRQKIVDGGAANIDLLKVESLAALQQNVDNCRELYNNNYNISNHPPMTPTDGENSLTLTPAPGAIEISWPAVPDNYTDPVNGNNDLAGYRIYRSTYFTIGPWNLIKELTVTEANALKNSSGIITYVDNNASYGVGNYYAITTFDTFGNESGKVNNNRFPVYSQRGSNAEFPNKVYVVPNPFRQTSHLYGQGERFRMEFIGLPAKCSIKIYTIYGDLVKEIKHDDGSGSQAWGSIEKLDYMLNDWLLAIAPGIYVYRVESQVSGQEGKSFIGKFGIIK